MTQTTVIQTAVTYNMVEAIRAQTELFGLLEKVVEDSAPVVLGRKVYLKGNFWGGWNYRSILMKIAMPDGNEPDGEFSYNWKIDLNQPTLLVFEEHKRLSLTLDLAAEFYFSLDDVEKKKSLQKFVDQALDQIKSKMP